MWISFLLGYFQIYLLCSLINGDVRKFLIVIDNDITFFFFSVTIGIPVYRYIIFYRFSFFYSGLNKTWCIRRNRKIYCERNCLLFNFFSVISVAGASARLAEIPYKLTFSFAFVILNVSVPVNSILTFFWSEDVFPSKTLYLSWSVLENYSCLPITKLRYR